jgi:uncharacterized protein YbaR (Trm112 family)
MTAIESETNPIIDLAMLDLLANPLHPDRPKLLLKGTLLVCPLTGVGFPIINGIPQLLPESVISKEEVDKILGQ